MPAAAAVGQAPSLATFLQHLKANDVDSSIELLVALLKRRQIRNCRPCAIATARLLLSVVAERRWRSPQHLIHRVREVGHRLALAQPREMAVGNIVRRVLAIVREVAEEDDDEAASASTTDALPSPAMAAEARRPAPPSHISGLSSLDSPPRRPPMQAAPGSYAGGAAPANSLFGLFSHPLGSSPMGTPPIGSGTASPLPQASAKSQEESKEKLDIKAEVINGIQDLLEELDIVDSQIAESAMEHIHNDEIILTHTSSQTIQRFLTTAARKRKFTVIHAEAYPNDHQSTHATIVNGAVKSGDDEDGDERWKPLTAMGITVILIPDSAVFALMSRINKVILAPHTVLANGSLIAAAGASNIAQAAKVHHVPVVVLSGVYKLSPIYPFANDEFIEYGDPGRLVPYQDGDFMDRVDVVNPIFDFVDADLIDLYITNLGGHAPSYLYRIVADHYRTEDIDLVSKA